MINGILATLAILGATVIWSGSEASPGDLVPEDTAPVGVASAFESQAAPSDPAGFLRATAAPRDRAELERVQLAQSIEDTPDAVPYTLHGRILSESGFPRSSVEIFPLGNVRDYARVDDSALDGTFTIDNVPAGEVEWAYAAARH